MSPSKSHLLAIGLSALCCLACATGILAASAPASSGRTPIATKARTTTATHLPKHARTSCKHSHRHHHKQRRCNKSGEQRHIRRIRGKGASHTGKPAPLVALNLAPASGPSPSATIARVLATPCQNTQLTPQADNLEAIGEATLCLVNQERARNNELPLQPNAQLTQVAQQHSEDMIASNYFSHTTPDGETQLDRVLASGYIPNSQVGYTIGENIAWGTSYLATPDAIVAAWIASPEHLANILNGEYRETGIGIDPAVPASLGEGQPGAIYTQEFGVIVQ